MKGLQLYPDTYIIQNEFLKDKIRKMCASNEVSKIIKNGSHNKNKEMVFMIIYLKYGQSGY